MGQTGKKKKLPNKDEGKPKKTQPVPVEDDDIEDGDIATPKRDRYGDDDQPLAEMFAFDPPDASGNEQMRAPTLFRQSDRPFRCRQQNDRCRHERHGADPVESHRR